MINLLNTFSQYKDKNHIWGFGEQLYFNKLKSEKEQIEKQYKSEKEHLEKQYELAKHDYEIMRKAEEKISSKYRTLCEIVKPIKDIEL